MILFPAPSINNKDNNDNCFRTSWKYLHAKYTFFFIWYFFFVFGFQYEDKTINKPIWRWQIFVQME